MKRTKNFSLLGATVLFLTIAQATFAADSGNESAADKQRKFIAILKSDAPPQDKAIPCKQLAIYGNKEAVPALAPLLADKELSSWARIALEAIPGPEADEALRTAVPKLQGLLLVGTMNSIGVRRDAKAVDILAGKLTDGDVEVVASAAAALGKIGGKQSAKALNQALSSASKQTLPVIAEGCILCAERFLADEKFTDAAQLYDAVRKADVPLQRKLEGIRGAILARQSDGIPMLLEQLRSPEKAEFGMALRTARELPGSATTEALSAELKRVTADRQVMLLLALADRKDSAVYPKLLETAEKSFKATRVATLGLLDRFNNVSAVPVLLNGAIDEDADIAHAAKSTLTRMEGKKIDAALMDRLPKSSGKTRQVIIELAALRRIEAAVPVLLASAVDADPGVRRAALATLSSLGSEKQVGDLVSLISKAKSADDRDGAEKALAGICGRTGTKAVALVLPLTKNNDSELRKSGLRVLAMAGGPEALGAVTAAVNDSDESVQDEAVGTLATWPNNWPEDGAVAEPLLGLVKTGKKRSYQVQGARGYLLYVQENKKLSNADKVKAIDDLLPLLKQPPEKRLAISALGGIPSGKSLDSLSTLAGDPAIAEEASLAIVNVATTKGLQGVSKEARQKALQTAIANSKNEATRTKAGEALKSIK